MLVDNKHYRTVWATDDRSIELIDQRWLPHEFRIEQIQSVEDMTNAIKDMHIRGAGAIGAAAGYGMYLAVANAPADRIDEEMTRGAELLKASRPTAVNLSYAVDRQLDVLRQAPPPERSSLALATANDIADEDAAACQNIGLHGVDILSEISKQKNGAVVNILTHCNAGWLAFVDHGSATAPVYEAHNRGMNVHVWVDETRPRNQGSRLTAWELGEHGVPHTIITDNAGGHLMQHSMVDVVIVGTDRTTRTGYVANKIGTYLKALAAKDNDIPFYVALPSSTIDWNIRDGVRDIPIEQRGDDEVKYATGFRDGKVDTVRIAPETSPAANYAFDVTPPHLITALITERGVVRANETSLLEMFPKMK